MLQIANSGSDPRKVLQLSGLHALETIEMSAALFPCLWRLMIFSKRTKTSCQFVYACENAS